MRRCRSKRDQVNAIAGLTRRITPDFLVGVLGGYEHFDYSSLALNGVLKGNGWTAAWCSVSHSADPFPYHRRRGILSNNRWTTAKQQGSP